MILDTVRAGSKDDGMLGTFRFFPVPTTGWYDGFIREKVSWVLVLSRTLGIKGVRWNNSAWHLKQISYS